MNRFEMFKRELSRMNVSNYAELGEKLKEQFPDCKEIIQNRMVHFYHVEEYKANMI